MNNPNNFTSTLRATCPKCATVIEKPGTFALLGCPACLGTIPNPGGAYMRKAKCDPKADFGDNLPFEGAGLFIQ